MGVIEYISEKIADSLLDTLKEKREAVELSNEILAFLNCQKTIHENDVALIDCTFEEFLKRITKSLLNETALKNLFNVNHETREKAKKSILDSCIQAAGGESRKDNNDVQSSDPLSTIKPVHTPNKDALRSVVKEIVTGCLNIVSNFYDKKIRPEDRNLASQITEEIARTSTDNKNEILQKIDKIKDELKKEGISNQPAAFVQTKSDNQDYLYHFTDRLFLEKDDSEVTLASMYVSPHIKDENCSAAEYIMSWVTIPRSQTPCMLLYGSAGVGKSSLVSKIITDANQDGENREFPLTKDQVLAVALRNHYDEIDINKKGEDILAALFPGYSIDELCSKLLILDGLDEICVLRKSNDNGFFGHELLKKLSDLERGFHILVTSRETTDYFNDPGDIGRLKEAQLEWTKKEISEWCAKYSILKEDKKAWCEQFSSEYSALSEDDRRREIFCVPLILYICGSCDLKLADHRSVGEIYDSAFRRILLRSHIQGQKNYADLEENEKKKNIIVWQYTKELAYQMFLMNTLDLVESDTLDNKYEIGLTNAKRRTEAFLKERFNWNEKQDVVLDKMRGLALCPFVKADGTGGITFAHKTVYQYFTAVKLYEDYFSKFNSDYFINQKDAARLEVMESLIEAFRYAAIRKEIWDYLRDMDRPTFCSEPVDVLPVEKTPQEKRFDKETFLKVFSEGMQQHLLSRIALRPAVEEYLRENTPLNVQFSLAFQNSTWYLTELGYKNEKRCNSALETIISGLLPTNQTLNFSGWDMENIDLSGTTLSGSNFTGANLSYAKLRSTDLSNANLCLTLLNGADLSQSNLTGAIFDTADLTAAKLSGVDLRKTNVLNAILTNAIYSAVSFDRTYFPPLLPINSKLHDDLQFDALALFHAYVYIVDVIGSGSGRIVYLPDDTIQIQEYTYRRIIEPFTAFSEIEQYIGKFLIGIEKEKVLGEIKVWYKEKDEKLYCLQGGRGDSLGYIISGTEHFLEITDDSFSYSFDLDFYGTIQRDFIMRCIKHNDTWYISKIVKPYITYYDEFY